VTTDLMAGCPRLMTRAETARFLRISLRALDKLRKAGEITFYKVHRGTIHFFREDIAAYLRKNEVPLDAN
jgi:excisionase family DNA binding protein